MFTWTMKPPRANASYNLMGSKHKPALRVTLPDGTTDRIMLKRHYPIPGIDYGNVIKTIKYEIDFNDFLRHGSFEGQ